MKLILRIVRLLIVLSVFSFLAVGLWAYLTLEDVLEQPVRVDEPVSLDVVPGSTPARVLANLENDGRIDRAQWLRRYWQWQMPDSVLQVGEYQLEPGMSAAELLRRLDAGEVVRRSVTLVEGWNFQQVRAQLAKAERLEQSLDPQASNEQVMTTLGLEGVHPEGRFFPDTYQYTFGMSDRDILLRSYQRMEEVLADVWQKRADDLPVKTPYEALILASIIERETGVPQERGEIAGVFTRRLRIGMRLQTDPTVIYGMGDAYQGNIRRSDLRRPTAYNTYTIDGLPPTPIAMPGRGALEAAVNPKSGTSLYFVARGDGSHVFSDSLREHNRAVQQYQIRQRAESYRSSPAASGGTGESAE
ncbi:aminodeoxychorismate lyase [Halopseudomonas salina]|uniref:Endolytic murein transglycosylase n=1 Tax=Halopseudomonas salina TaxID=1323744 RepID=A0ABQ1PUG6_9GAMM|nr:aminodeoxychorismate lyase [Halopseudomonas salina]